MKYYINLVTNKSPNSHLIKSTRIQSSLIPTEEQFKEWKIKSLEQFIVTGQSSLLILELSQQDFKKFVIKCYKSIGKNIDLHEENKNLYRIPTRQGAFFEEINHLMLYNDEYQSNIAVIKIKELCQKN